MPIITKPQFEQASIYSDLNSLDAIRKQGITDKSGAMRQAAKEFEAFFMNMMLKSMRQASEVMGENSLSGSQEEKMFTGMMDEQLSINLSQAGHLGIAELMMSQLSMNSASDNSVNKTLDDNVMKGFENLRIMRRGGWDKKETSQLDGQAQRVEAHPLSAEENVTIATNRENFASKEQLNSAGKFNKTLKNIREVAETETATFQHQPSLIKPEKKSLFNEAADFISTLLPYAKQAAEKLSLDPRVLIAQAALETGWGKFIMHDDKGNPGFNMFGIKAGKSWAGESIQIDTLEVEQQVFKKVNASFRKYQDFSQAFDDYVDFLKNNPRYQKALNSTESSDSFVKELQASGYATDPNYGSKIMRIFNKIISGSFELGAQ